MIVLSESRYPVVDIRRGPVIRAIACALIQTSPFPFEVHTGWKLVTGFIHSHRCYNLISADLLVYCGIKVEECKCGLKKQSTYIINQWVKRFKDYYSIKVVSVLKICYFSQKTIVSELQASKRCKSFA